MPYDLSDSIPIAVDVRDADGDLTNATTATLTITLPDGTIATPTVANPPSVTGEYREIYIPTQVGRYAWRFVTTTPNTAYQDVFEVRETTSPSLLSIADAKAHLNITSTSNDDELREYLEAATEIVEQYVGPIVRRTYTVELDGGVCMLALPHTQVLSIAALTLVRDGSSPLLVSDIHVDTESGVATRDDEGPFPDGRLSVSYTVGRVYVKPNWTLAAKIIVKHNWESQLGNLPSIQGDDPGYVVSGSGYLVPYRALALLEPDNVSVGFA